ncbi:uncharacterized protein LOC144753407 [Lissotriton helveticus]
MGASNVGLIGDSDAQRSGRDKGLESRRGRDHCQKRPESWHPMRFFLSFRFGHPGGAGPRLRSLLLAGRGVAIWSNLELGSWNLDALPVIEVEMLYSTISDGLEVCQLELVQDSRRSARRIQEPGSMQV